MFSPSEISERLMASIQSEDTQTLSSIIRSLMQDIIVPDSPTEIHEVAGKIRTRIEDILGFEDIVVISSERLQKAIIASLRGSSQKLQDFFLHKEWGKADEDTFLRSPRLLPHIESNGNHRDTHATLQRLLQHPLLTTEQEIVLGERIMSGSVEALDELELHNMRLVYKIAGEYGNRGLDFDDLVSEGRRGLRKAAHKFDPTLGRFSTYAAWWIHQGIKRALCNQVGAFRIPVHMYQKIYKLRGIIMALTDTLGREPSDREIAEDMKIPEKRVRELKFMSAGSVSLDAPFDGEDEDNLYDILADLNAANPSDEHECTDVRALLERCVSTLGPKESTIIELRYGLNGQKPKTLEEVGRKFGVTRERIRQIQVKAVKKLRIAMAKNEDPNPTHKEGLEVKKLKKKYLRKTQLTVEKIFDDVPNNAPSYREFAAFLRCMIPRGTFANNVELCLRNLGFVDLSEVVLRYAHRRGSILHIRGDIIPELIMPLCKRLSSRGYPCEIPHELYFSREKHGGAG